MIIPLMVAALLFPQSAPPTEKELGVLVRQLNSEDPQVRDKALQKLEAAGDLAVPFLREGARTGEAETQARCRELLQRLEVEPGARNRMDWTTCPELIKDKENRKRYEELLTEGRTAELLKEDYRWLLTAVDGLLSDRRPVVEGSMRLLHEIIRRRALDAVKSSDLATKPQLGNFRKAEVRIDEYVFWTQWWFTVSARNIVAAWEKAGTAEGCKALLGGRDPEAALATLRSAGPAAWPTLASLITTVDLATSRAAVAALKALTGRASAEPDDKSVPSIREDWEKWIRDRR